MKVSTCSIATGLGSKEQIQPTVENWSDTWVLQVMISKLDMRVEWG
jgi:hypothetical protein